MLNKSYLSIFIIIFSVYAVRAQTEKPVAGIDYNTVMKTGDFKAALKIIMPLIEDANSKRVDDKKIPSDFITLGAGNEGMSKTRQMNKLFRERKVEPFFIENDPELSALHRAAAKCMYETNIFDDALNHYYQSMRYHQPEADKDDQIFYEMAQVYRKKGLIIPYCDMLEDAYDLNSRNLDYSLELGRALYRTKDKKKAIFHLERYVQAKGDELKELDVLIMLAGLNEEINRFLETQKYYQLYLEKKPNDGFIHFALGHIACKNTGDYRLARNELGKAIETLPEKEIFRKAKAYEYIADMSFDALKFERATSEYLETIKYQDMVMKEIEKNNDEIRKIDSDIRTLKTSLLKEKNYVQYNEYQFQMQEKERFLSERREKKYEYAKLEPGKSRWNIAECYEKAEKNEDAVNWYRQAITFSYRPNDAREKIAKLQLKIKRGY